MIDIKISAVIATAVAGITLGNYGRYKITEQVEQSIEKFLAFFAFITNSLVFILLGLILSDININLSYFLPAILVAIFIVITARALSIYIPL